MQKDLLTDIDKAIIYIKSKDLSLFEQTLTQPNNNGLFDIVLLYYSAKGQLLRQIQTKKGSISEQEKINFTKNSSRLDEIKNEVEIENFDSLTKKYNEAIILGALVQLIRDNEANILSYNKYTQLKSKFRSWPQYGIKSQKILLSWKNFSNAIREVEDWLSEKKDNYLPIVEKIVAEYENNQEITSSELFKAMDGIPEKESYYVICNVLLTNPVLRKDFLSISMLSGEQLLVFENKLYSILDIMSKGTTDKTLKGLIILFKQQIKIQRPELENST